MTVFDYHEQVSRSAYRALNIFAWSNPTVNPLILTFVINANNSCCHREGGNVDIYGDKGGSRDMTAMQNTEHPTMFRKREHEMGSVDERASLNSHL